MKTLCLSASVLLSALSASSALAQEPDAPSGAAAPLPATPTTAAPRTGVPCTLVDHEGIADADALTATRLICAEIAHRPRSAGQRYTVSIGKLGSLTVLIVGREGSTPDAVADSREMRLQSIEEVSVAAPRIAESIVDGTPLPETAKVDNLVGDETRKFKTRSGSVHFALGLIGQLPPFDQGLGPAAGVDFDVHYETESFELGGAFRVGEGQASDTAPKIAFAAASVGGAYFFSDADFSPYAGGGLSWGTNTLDIPGGFNGQNGGLGAYATGGVEFFRTHHAHLALGARLDLPFYSLNTTNAYYSCANPPLGGGCTSRGSSSYYYAPLSLELRVTF